MTARRRRRRGERGLYNDDQFFPRFFGEICQRILLLCISSLDWIFLPHKSIFACALLQRCCLSWSFVPRMGFGNAYVPSSYHHHQLLTSTTSGMSRRGLAIHIKKAS
jgi:hypothetical protein